MPEPGDIGLALDGGGGGTPYTSSFASSKEPRTLAGLAPPSAPARRRAGLENRPEEEVRAEKPCPAPTPAGPAAVPRAAAGGCRAPRGQPAEAEMKRGLHECFHGNSDNSFYL